MNSISAGQTAQWVTRGARSSSTITTRTCRPSISLSKVTTNWGGPFTRHFDTDEKAATLNRDHVNAYWEGGALWVELDPAEFFACPTIEGQEEILRRFLRDVVTTLVDA